jgi:hypothetical protein
MRQFAQIGKPGRRFVTFCDLQTVGSPHQPALADENRVCNSQTGQFSYSFHPCAGYLSEVVSHISRHALR